MVVIKLLVLSLACVCAIATPPIGPVTRNTIFADERFEGQIFKDVDAFDNIELTPSNAAVSPYRLPNTTAPSHYSVLWVIDIPAMTYSGSVDITLHAKQANVNEIVIHCDYLTVTLLSLRQGTTNITTTYIRQPEYQFLRIAITNGVLQYNANNPVHYTLRIEFNAAMRNDMYGIYRSWYRNLPTDENVIRWMASTQFQGTSARFAFPCYDEPSFKATFNVTIRRPTAYKSWSCTRLLTTVNSVFAGYQDDIYYTTPVMSTYLLALIVADYDSVNATQNGLITHEVIARPGAIAYRQAEYPQETGIDLLAKMNEHTDYNFYLQNPNLKMTQAAIPDFQAGAMENWGLLTYREAYLLYDRNHTNSLFKQRIAYILSHEIAHMWFGNLVTNEWWDVVWLNEGFARYYQYFLTYWVVDMGLASRFIDEQVHTALLSDSSNNPQPLTNPRGVSGSPASVSAMFSTITYNKGASVIRMTEHLLTTNIQFIGLRNYLKVNEFKTVKPIDLFNALEQAGNVNGAFDAYGPDFNFVDYFLSWTEQPGHPVLNVQINHQTGQMTIYQRRFNINTGYSSYNTKYIIPITFTSGSNPNFNNTKPSHILTDAVTVIDRDSYGDHWTILNIQQTGFYRVNYDDYTWNLIIRALRGSDRVWIHEYNRAQIVDDVFQFARSGIMSYERALNILSFLEFETEYTPWVAAITGFNWLRNRLIGSDLLPILDRTIIEWSTLVMSQLTYYPIPNESFMRSYLRLQLAPFLCNLNVTDCRTSARIQFLALRNNRIEVPVDSRNWVYCNGLRHGTEADFTFLWNRFHNHNVYTEKILLLQTLGCTPHATSLNTLLDAIVENNTIIRPQDYTTAYSTAVSGNENNTQIVFTYIKENLQKVTTGFGNAATPLSYISARLRSEQEILEFQTWANNTRNELSTSYASVYNGAEETRRSFAFAANIADDLGNYFENGTQEFTTTPSPTTTTLATSPQPNLVRPVTPDLPQSAATTFVSIFLLVLAAITHIIL